MSYVAAKEVRPGHYIHHEGKVHHVVRVLDNKMGTVICELHELLEGKETWLPRSYDAPVQLVQVECSDAARDSIH
jgi:translation elongation factor P/translation initiation factor 5A